MNGTGGEGSQPSTGPNAGPSADPSKGAGPGGQLAPGTVLNRTHRIEALLAQGGMGQVYRATNLATGDTVAIKVMRPEFFNDPRINELFLREGAALRKLRHPAIVDYEGTFLGEGGQLYLVMEFVDGPSLAAAARGRALAPARCGSCATGWRPGSPRRTRSASSIATSRPTTSSCRADASMKRSSSISASPSTSPGDRPR